jgi:NADPH:quinone reductase-like Zn-dependent oxidoreductase
LGCDVAGEVVEIGARVRGVTLNKPVIVSPGIVPRKTKTECLGYWDSLCDNYQVLGLQVDGGYAEYVKVPDRNIIPVSKRLDYEQWAAVPLVFLTAYHMLLTRAQLKRKETILIHAAGSGVGSAGIQIAKYLGAEVITTVGRDQKVKPAKDLGANHVINYNKSDFVAEVLKLTHGKGVDVVLEHIGPATFSKSLACLARKGRLVTCGVTSGPTINLDLRFIFSRQLSIIGCYMGGFKELKEVIRLVEAGKLHPVVDKVYPLRQAKEALDRMKARENFGKIILTPA